MFEGQRLRRARLMDQRNITLYEGKIGRGKSDLFEKRATISIMGKCCRVNAKKK